MRYIDANPEHSRGRVALELLQTPFGGAGDTMAEKTLSDAFHETLKDVYYAEKQSVRALKKAAKAAQNPDLKAALTQHAEESAGHVDRLVQVFETIGKSPRAKTCEAMQGLTAEMDEDLEDFGGTEASDDVLIGCAQAMEHYEIARYGLLKSWSIKLGNSEATHLLDATLGEEKAADALLSQIADGSRSPDGSSDKSKSTKATPPKAKG